MALSRVITAVELNESTICHSAIDLACDQEFVGTGNGFTVKVADTRKPVTRTARGYYDVETEGEWLGPGRRQFKSTGVDRVYVKDGSPPSRANVLSFRTVCPR